MEKVSAIILAAGKGKRTGLSFPKVLYPLCGQPMIRWVVEAASSLPLEEILVVVSPEYAEEFSRTLGGKVKLVIQREPKGTGHALSCGIQKLAMKKGTLLVACGDTPLLTAEIFQNLLAFHVANKAAATLLGATVFNPAGYGRILRNSSGKIARIIEEADATDKEKKIQEINSGTYCFQFDAIQAALSKLSPQNRQREYYLTDSIAWLVKRKDKVYSYLLGDGLAALGVNTLSELAEAGKRLNRRLLEKWAASGVIFPDPETIYLDADVTIRRGTTVHPFTFLEKGTRVGENCQIGPFSRLIHATVGNNAVIQNSVVVESHVGEGCLVGPFAYLRSGTQLEEKVRIGDFVETKNSSIGPGSKVPHLSYIGDAVLGANVNIGAGTITCNYDGKEKYPTVIEDGAFIGSNSNLRAPVRIGKNAVTGAGSVVIEDVAANTTVAGVPAKVIKRRKEDRHGG